MRCSKLFGRRQGRSAKGEDQANLDLLWLRDRALEAGKNLPEPGVVLAAEIFDDLHAALEAFQAIAGELAPSGEPT